MTRQNWQRQELLLALHLYCRLPFGKYHRLNPAIIELAHIINRTPDAVAMKLANFASFDPYHQARGIKGLRNAARSDREIWEEFNNSWNDLAVQTEALYGELVKISSPVNVNAEYIEQDTFTGPTEIERLTKVRLGQRFFRRVILTGYANKCCICGIPIPELLIAGHIVPWSIDANLRVNPHNGLCLCALHDKAFDRGLFTLGEDYQVVIGKALRQNFPNEGIRSGFAAYDGQSIALPDKFLPEQSFLEIHRIRVFLG
jgi:predicted restriction endonuclease